MSKLFLILILSLVSGTAMAGNWKYSTTKDEMSGAITQDEKISDNKMMAELLHASVAQDCNGNKKIAISHYTNAIKYGSVNAQSSLDKLTKH